MVAVALVGTGLPTTVGVIVAMDSYGPATDNAHGIAEMSGDVTGAGAEVPAYLDAVGNTTKAITRAWPSPPPCSPRPRCSARSAPAVQDALATGGHAAASFSLSVDRPNVLVGVHVGGAVVFLFVGMAIMAVGRAAGRMVVEVRDQFRQPGIMEGTRLAD